MLKTEILKFLLNKTDKIIAEFLVALSIKTIISI